MKEEIEYLKEELQKLQQKYDTMLTVSPEHVSRLNININSMFDCSDVRGESGGGRGAQTGLARCEGDVQNADRSVNQF